MRKDEIVVPWVALWTGEQIDMRRLWLRPGPNGLHYADEIPQDSFMDVLWHRERSDVGSGGPLFGRMHNLRQRQAMLSPCCQVCKDPLPAVDIEWVLPECEYKMMTQAPTNLTTTPPTCARCWDVASRRCPHLRQEGFVRFFARRALPWGVQGGLYHPSIKLPEVRARFGDPKIPHMLARKLVMHIDGLTLASEIE